MTIKARRVHSRIVFGEGAERWCVNDPGSTSIYEAGHRARHDYDCFKRSHALLLAETVSDFVYLVHTCPTTKLACEKLAKLRAAVRALPEEEE